MRSGWFVCALLYGFGCGGGDDSDKDKDKVIGGDRPVTVHVPATEGPKPLLLLLHGYSVDADIQESYLGFTAAADEYDFIYARANGTLDGLGNRFWNATDACCDFFETGVDDSAYLRSVLEEIIDAHDVDTSRVFVFGHSNGHFMTYRMACDHADLITGIAGIAGSTFLEPADCAPSNPVHVLHIHGTDDTTIRYEGGVALGGQPEFPSATTTASTWANYNGCNATAQTGDALDLDDGIAGDETADLHYQTDCQTGSSVTLWSIEGGRHIPTLSPTFATSVFDYFMSRSPR